MTALLPVWTAFLAGHAVYVDKHGLLTVVNDNPDLTDMTTKAPRASSPQEVVDLFNLGYPVHGPRRVLEKPEEAIQVFRGWGDVLVKKSARRESDTAVFAAVKKRGRIKEDDLLELASELEMSVANTRRHLRYIASEGHIVFDADAGYYFAR